MILTQVLCPERAQLFFIMATAFISLCHFPVCFHPNPSLFTYQLRFKSGSTLVQLCSGAEVNRTWTGSEPLLFSEHTATYHIVQPIFNLSPIYP